MPEECIAALDIGSNTVRLLVAEVGPDNLEPLLDESAFVRLGLGVDRTGVLDPEREAAALAAIRQLADRARSLDARQIVAIATSAVRDARNGAAFVQQVQRDTGVEVEIISGDREARLTYLGATLGLTITGPTLVVDLGGGSAELILAGPDGLSYAASRPLGSGRLTERFVREDPPQDGAREEIDRSVDAELKGLATPPVDGAILTGGTATRVNIIAEAEGFSSPLDAADLERVVDILFRLPSARVVETYGIEVDRAHVLPAGAAALNSITDRYRAPRISIVRRGIREGAIIDTLQQRGWWAR